ncbi:MAG: rRNA pseudouridine synthase [Oscillospiraceae bacterium]|nr:rRNA pseudouridine synthase [Oscillospiraceae bacterium]
MEERLQKILSARGLLSRRTAEEYIQAGRVQVNGKPASLGQKADPDRDHITIDGADIGDEPADRVYLMLNKPRGCVTTLSDEQGRKTAAELVKDCRRRVWPVGRLDLNSEGLLLFTDDGGVTNRLTHPSHEVEKEYHVWVTGDVESALPKLRRPMALDGVKLRPAKVRLLNREAGKLSIVIHEGKNRQVRRMCAQAGLTVVRLRRVREGKLTLGALKAGQWRYLTERELEWLLKGR